MHDICIYHRLMCNMFAFHDKLYVYLMMEQNRNMLMQRPVSPAKKKKKKKNATAIIFNKIAADNFNNSSTTGMTTQTISPSCRS